MNDRSAAVGLVGFPPRRPNWQVSSVLRGSLHQPKVCRPSSWPTPRYCAPRRLARPVPITQVLGPNIQACQLLPREPLGVPPRVRAFRGRGPLSWVLLPTRAVDEEVQPQVVRLAARLGELPGVEQ